MKIRTAAVTVICLPLLAACGTTSQPATASTSPTAKTPTETCRDLLEDMYAKDNIRDASGEPGCSGLTHDEYVDLVGEVLKGHAGEIVADAADEHCDDTIRDEVQKIVDTHMNNRPGVGEADADAIAEACPHLSTEETQERLREIGLEMIDEAALDLS
ncbi:MAG TPA: hypothetical protein VFY14_03990 [Streptomyces sp.]|nr:hypothetical protein [Streptomyces sp.]